MSNEKFFINEENMGPEAEKAHADSMIKKLQELGWNVSYGDSTNNRATEYERQVFDSAWNAYIHTPKSWMVLRSDKFGPEAVPAEHRSE